MVSLNFGAIVLTDTINNLMEKCSLKLLLYLSTKPLPVEVNNSTIELHLPVEAKEKRAIVELKPSPVEVNNSS